MGQNLLNGGEGIVLAHADDGLHGGDVVGMARIVSVAFHDGQEGPVLLHGGHVVPDALEGSGPDEGDDGQVEPVVVLGGCPWLLLLLCLLLPLFLGQTLLVLLLLLLHPRVQLEGGVGHVHGILVVAQSAEGSGQVEKDGDVGPRELSSGRAEGLVAVEGRRRRRGAVHHRQIQAAVGGHLEVLGGGGQVVGPVGDVAEVVLDEHPQERHVPGEVGGDRIEHRPGNLVRFAGLLVGPVVLVEQADVEEGEGREGVGLLDLGGHGRGGRLESPPALLHDASPPGASGGCRKGTGGGTAGAVSAGGRGGGHAGAGDGRRQIAAAGSGQREVVVDGQQARPGEGVESDHGGLVPSERPGGVVRIDVIVHLLGPLGGVGPTEVRDGLAKVVEVIVHFVDRRTVLLVCGVGAPALFGRLGRVLGADAGLDALRVRLHGVVGPGGAAVVVGGPEVVEEGGRLEAVRVELLVGGH